MLQKNCQTAALALALLGTVGKVDRVWAAEKPRSFRPSVSRIKSAPIVNTAGKYILGSEDVIEITVSNHPDLNRTLTVRPDGRITLPEVGDVVAAGKTAPALASHIQRLLERTLNNARVEIVVKEARSQRARVTGAVKTGGSFDIKQNWRVMDIVAAAGGLSTKPTRISGRVIRAGTVLPFNIETAVSQPASNANLLLKSNDLVVLEERDIFKQITVAGNVAKPGTYDLEENLTVVSLLAQAGGTNDGAALKQAHILRKGTRIPLDLQQAVTKGKQDPVLAGFKFQPGDVLVIPENQLRFGVMGQVVKPGYYTLPEEKENSSITKALALAGGALQPASESGTKPDLRGATLTRIVNGESQTIPVNIDAILKGEQPDNVFVQENDILLIPKLENQVHVIGQVGKPGAYDLKDGMSLVSLVAEAGSPVKGAGLSKAYVLRSGTQIPVDLNALLIEGKIDQASSNFHLQKGDVLVVPNVSNQVSVIGQVEKPGAYDLSDNLSVLSLVAQAGSKNDGASLKKAYVQRGNSQVPLDLYSVLIKGEKNPLVLDFRFQPGDVLVVPENQSRFGVLGSVAKPGYFSFPEDAQDATVLKALAEAGGPLQGTPGQGSGAAALSKAGIVRTINGQATVIPVNIDEILKKGNLATNFYLQPDDVLYIPSKKPGFDWRSVIGPLAIFTR